MDEQSPEIARSSLEDLQEFPCIYHFKFIVPAALVEETRALFPEGATDLRPSKRGTYVSVRADLHVDSADEVRAYYARAAAIPGLIAL